MACGRSLCSLSQLVIILVLYLSMSNLSSSGEPLRHSRYVDRDMFYAAVVFTKPSPPTMSSHSLRLTKPLQNPLDNTRIVMSSCYLLQKAFLAMVLTSMSNDISVNPGPISTDFPRVRGLKIAHLNVRSLTGIII